MYTHLYCTYTRSKKYCQRYVQGGRAARDTSGSDLYTNQLWNHPLTGNIQRLDIITCIYISSLINFGYFNVIDLNSTIMRNLETLSYTVKSNAIFMKDNSIRATCVAKMEQIFTIRDQMISH